jgi:riboflavin biosynthesis pyrimidine reductase
MGWMPSFSLAKAPWKTQVLKSSQFQICIQVSAFFLLKIEFVCNSSTLGQLSLPALLQALHEEGITSLMVEGGQRVISSFLSANPSLVDVLVVTVAPMLVGHAGVEALSCDSAVSLFSSV